jgi:hypothetical protein
MSDGGCVPIKLYLQEQVVGHSWLTPTGYCNISRVYMGRAMRDFHLQRIQTKEKSYTHIKD